MEEKFVPVYVVAQLTFTDRSCYERYQARFEEVFREGGGQLLVADEAPVLLEGDWFGDKLVIMSFESDASARRFLQSSEYQEISRDRKRGTETVALMARGFQLQEPEGARA